MLVRLIWYLGALLFYLGLASYNLGLPGLHYDEAKEAGLNAMQIVTGQSVTAFRDTTLVISGIQFPLMVQDYIGAINVYLSIPILSLSGIGVPNLRFLSIAIGLVTLLCLERTVSNWIAPRREQHEQRVPISLAGLISVTLLAVSPSFVFWSRQGIFVTNVIQPLAFAFMWMGLVWLRTDRNRSLILAGGLAGLSIYGKLISLWVVLPFTLYIIIISWIKRRENATLRLLFLRNWLLFGLMFSLPLLPLLLFNIQTEGTWRALLSNAEESYYGVDNMAILSNASLRWTQLADVLRGSQFWYLGGTFRNELAPWIALFAIVGGLLVEWRLLFSWLLIVGGAFLLSLFTISDLFITHYALLHPLVIGLVGLGTTSLLSKAANLSSRYWPSNIVLNKKSARFARVVVLTLLVGTWVAADGTASIHYHQALEKSGGLGDHSDASYKLAYHLRYNGMGAPITLDWGMDAPIRYLSEGTVKPIEIFGYASHQKPDEDFSNRLSQFLNNPDNVYLLHSSGTTVFAGRREVFFNEVDSRGLTSELEKVFLQRDGTPLFELWRVK